MIPGSVLYSHIYLVTICMLSRADTKEHDLFIETWNHIKHCTTAELNLGH